MNVALDAMGGDRAPEEVVAGALLAAPLMRRKILLVGQPDILKPLLGPNPPDNVELVAASEIVDMSEKPLDALRKKKDSSLWVAANLVKDGRAAAMVSAGNTGAASAAALLAWRQVPGIHRPAIASQMPHKVADFLLLDAGASPDVEPQHLVEFAKMGRAYVAQVWGRKDGRVRLLNIGEEPGKGNAFAKDAHCLLAEYPWFEGNIEGKDMFSEPCDVVVCDAFVGNVALKTCEGIAEHIVSMVREGIPKNPLHRALYWPVKKVIAPLRKKMDYAEIGGSPLLGLNGLCIIAHGRSNAKAIMNALLLAQKGIEGSVVDTIRNTMAPEEAKA